MYQNPPEAVEWLESQPIGHKPAFAPRGLYTLKNDVGTTVFDLEDYFCPEQIYSVPWTEADERYWLKTPSNGSYWSYRIGANYKYLMYKMERDYYGDSES